jgi:hypothetical protein
LSTSIINEKPHTGLSTSIINEKAGTASSTKMKSRALKP